jgi:hypothetical protein
MQKEKIARGSALNVTAVDEWQLREALSASYRPQQTALPRATCRSVDGPAGRRSSLLCVLLPFALAMAQLPTSLADG